MAAEHRLRAANANIGAARATFFPRISLTAALGTASAETFSFSRVRYTNGIDSYLSILDAQRSLYRAKQGLVSLQLTRQAAQTMLYKVLGGGIQAVQTRQSALKNYLTFGNLIAYVTYPLGYRLFDVVVD